GRPVAYVGVVLGPLESLDPEESGNDLSAKCVAEGGVCFKAVECLGEVHRKLPDARRGQGGGGQVANISGDACTGVNRPCDSIEASNEHGCGQKVGVAGSVRRAQLDPLARVCPAAGSSSKHPDHGGSVADPEGGVGWSEQSRPQPLVRVHARAAKGHQGRRMSQKAADKMAGAFCEAVAVAGPRVAENWRSRRVVHAELLVEACTGDIVEWLRHETA